MNTSGTQTSLLCNWRLRTGHKLQGTRNVEKQLDCVASWNCYVPKWMRVVLSRERTLKGLFLCQKLNETKSFPKLIDAKNGRRRMALRTRMHHKDGTTNPGP